MQTAPSALGGKALFDGLTFKVAGETERRQAIEFQNEVYRAEFGDPATDEQEARAFCLIALGEAGEIAATFRLVDERPFEIERYLDLGPQLPPNRRPAELGRLCVRPSWRRVRQQTFLHLGLLKLAFEFALTREITDFVIGSLENLQRFYAKALFRPLEMSYNHPIGGTLYVMRLDLLELKATKQASDEPFFQYLLGPRPTNIIL